MSNLETWKKLSNPPKDALKQIQAGRLKNKTDINPQWRYEAMTEVFGVCGVGWKFEIESTWIDEGPDGQKVQNVKVLLYIKEGKEWSSAIPGMGGSMLVAKESAGLRTNDEAVKMATTDALSTSMKMLGVASAIYRGMWDGSNYKEPLPPKKKKTYKNIEFLKEMTTLKGILGDVKYYEKLKKHGYYHSNEIPPENQAGALTSFNSLVDSIEGKGS